MSDTTASDYCLHANPIMTKCLETDNPRDTEGTCLQTDNHNKTHETLCP